MELYVTVGSSNICSTLMPNRTTFTGYFEATWIWYPLALIKDYQNNLNRFQLHCLATIKYLKIKRWQGFYPSGIVTSSGITVFFSKRPVCVSDRCQTQTILPHNITVYMCERGFNVSCPLAEHVGFFLSHFANSDDVTRVQQDLQAATVNPDPSLKEFEGATLRYASLKLRWNTCTDTYTRKKSNC